MEQFVCVRLVQANGMDLSLFQFDYDLTFSVFFLNADGTIYGRFGSRSAMKEAEKDISIEGFGKALAAVLEMHEDYPANKALFVDKKGAEPPYPVPEEYPSLKESGRFKATLDFEGEVARSCIHCHQVRDAERLIYRTDGEPIPDSVLYPWPMPDVLGIAMDPNEKATLAEVAEGSPAAADGFVAGDAILSLEGQPVVSIADVQWVLQNAEEPAEVQVVVLRDGKQKDLVLTLREGWRRTSEISWRPTTWDLRRMGAGGILFEDLAAPDRAKLGLRPEKLALRIKHLGANGPHGAAKRAGFQRGDILVEFDGRTEHMTETALLAHAVQKHVPGDRVPTTVLRDGKRIELELPMQ